MGAVVGIDLGTTNTVVAAIRDGHPVAMPDDSGSTLIPSIVSFLPSGAVLVGSTASERRSQDPRNTIYSVKRLIGRTWDSPEVQKAITRFPFELREGPGRATFVIARGETYTLPEISAFVLRKAKSLAELELGETVDRAVITVPANFNDLQRAATKVAGRVAGLEVLRILNEPTAAALAFGHQHGNRERIAVYDLGGGTFDFTLLLLTDDVFEVLATSGDTFLGGDDIDGAIADRIAKSTGTNVNLSPKQQPELLERLRAIAERVKIELSTKEATRVKIEDLELGGTHGLEFSISREELDGLAAPLVERTFQVCKDALTAAKLTPKDIDHVLLVGGSTRTPFVKRRVEEYFGKRVRDELDPHEVVALGAARQAMALTQLRATASGIPVPPPRRPTVPDHSSGVTSRAEDAVDLSRKPTDAGVGAGEPIDLGRVSVAPPEFPLTSPVPNTKKLGSRDRRTTGLGLGPHEPAPLHQSAEVVPSDLLQATEPPSTLSGLGPGRGEVDLPLVLPSSTKAANLPTPAARRMPFAASGKSETDESDAPELPAVAHPASPAASKPTRPNLLGRKPQPTIPDDIGSWGPPVDNAKDVGLPIVTSATRTEVERSVTKISAETPDTARRSLDLLADLPLVVGREPKGVLKTQPSAQVKPQTQRTLSDLRPPFPTDDTEDEPTVIRRSTQSSAELGDAADFGAALDDLPAIATPEDKPELPAVFSRSAEEPLRRSGSSASMNDEEIRARYGNLPLIVGGRRMGARGSDPGIEPYTLDVNAEVSTGTESAAKASDELPALVQAAPNALSPLSPPTAPRIGVLPDRQNTGGPVVASASIPSLDPDDVEPFDEGTVRILRAPHAAEPTPRATAELDWSIPDEAVPKSQRPLSARPTGKQQPEDELTLPVPDLPPSPLTHTQGRTGPNASRPMDFSGANIDVVRPSTSKSPERIASTLPLPQAPNPAKDRTAHINQSLASAATIPLGIATPLAAGAWQPPVASPVVMPAVGSQTRGEIPSLLASLPRLTAARPALLIDVTPLSLCVETVGGYVDVVISRNSTVPCERTRDFVTAQDNQQAVVVRVAQGESKVFQENVLLGEVHLTGLPEAPRSQSRIAVTFGIDSDGILHVRALDIASGLSALADLRLSGAPSSPEVAQMMARHSARHQV